MNIQDLIIQKQNLAALKYEFPRRRQIFDESVAIIQETNNPDVLYRRYREVVGFVDWAFEMQRKGMPIKIDETEEEMRENVPSFYNFHCARIAKFVSENGIKKKRYQILKELLSSLKDAQNKEEAHIEISQIINKIITEK